MSEPKKYGSLGQMIKSGDFTALLEKVSEYNEKEIKVLTSVSEENPISELDKAIFFVPDYFYKKNEEGEKTKDINNGVFEFLTWALNKGGNPHATIKFGVSCFLKSCELPSDDLVKFLENSTQNFDLHQKDGKGKDAIMYSVLGNSEAVFDFLTSKNEFDINNQYILLHNKTILHGACANANEVIIDKILALNGDLTKMDDNENLPRQMIPTPQECDLPEEEVTEEKAAMWDKLYQKLETKTQEQTEAKKLKKFIKPPFKSAYS